MASYDPLFENIVLSIGTIPKLFAANKFGLLLTAIVLHQTGWASINPTDAPALLIALLLAHSYGYLQFPDTSPISEPTNLSASKGPSANLLVVGLIACHLLGFRFDSTILNSAHSPTLIIVLVLGYAYGYLKIPEVNFAGEDPGVNKALPAIKAVAKRAEPYFKLGLLVALATYFPVYHDVPLPLQPWLHIVILAGVAVVGYFVAPAKFHGPARYGYLKYAYHISRLYEVLDWRFFIGLLVIPYWFFPQPYTIYSTFFPTISLSLIAISVSAWLYIYVEYRKQLLAITDQVAKDISRINTAASSTSKYASEVFDYDKQLFTAASTARRDAIKASATRITDFFVCGTTAWASFAEITESARQITLKTEAVVEAATNVEDTEKPDFVPENDDDRPDSDDDDVEPEESRIQILSRQLREQADATSETVAQVLLTVEAAQAKVRECENAQKQDKAARARAEYNAKAASAAVGALSANLTESRSQSLAVEVGAEKARRLADQAVEAATYGEMEAAKGYASEVKTEADEGEGAAEKGREALDAARVVLLGWLQGK